MQLGRMIALLLACNTAWAAGLAPFRIAGVNACLGMGAIRVTHAALGSCADGVDWQVYDGSMLSVKTTLSQNGQGQLDIEGSAKAGYGVLQAGMSSALTTAASFSRASSQAQAGFQDILTISSPALNGKPGLLNLRYTLSGSGSPSLQSTSFATVRVLAGVFLEQQQTKLHTNSEWGLFSLSQPIRFTFGVPFGLELMLESANRLGAMANESESGTANLAEVLVLSGLIPADQQGNPVNGAQFASASETQYGVDGVTSNSPPPSGSTPPFISSIQPASVPAGTMVRVSGMGFLPTVGSGSGGDTGGNTVYLGAQVVIKNLNSPDGLTLEFQVPPNFAPGTYSLSVANQNGASNSVGFTVTNPTAGSPPPVISSLQPTSGPPGAMVKVSGTGFLPTFGSGSAGNFGGNTVYLGSQIVIKNLNSQDGLTLQVQVPPNTAPGTYSLSVSNQNGTSNAVSFTVTNPTAGSPAPAISSLQPTSAPPAAMVKISGTGFLSTVGSGSGGDNGGNTVYLGSQAVIKNLNSPDGFTLEFQVPPNFGPGTYTLSVSNQNGASNAVSFTVTNPSADSPPPVISSLQPTSGPPAAMVKVSGTGFLPTFGSGSGGDFGGNTVYLGSQIVIKNLNSQDGFTLQFQVPPNTAPGTYSLSVSNQNGTSNTVSFTVTNN